MAIKNNNTNKFIQVNEDTARKVDTIFLRVETNKHKSCLVSAVIYVNPDDYERQKTEGLNMGGQTFVLGECQATITDTNFSEKIHDFAIEKLSVLGNGSNFSVIDID